jgi:hypothetical protein
VFFIVRKTASKLERAILTTLYLAGAKRTNCVLFLYTFRWFILPKPNVATGDIYLFIIEFTQGEAIHFEDLEFIVDHLDN